jgi:amino-acid N-acetyltransferase
MGKGMNQEARVLSENLSAAVRMRDDEAIRFVDWVRGAAPYFHAFRGKTFVIAFGGEVAHGTLMEYLCHDCNLLAALGVRSGAWCPAAD